MYCEIEWEEACGGMLVSQKIEQWLNVKFLIKFGQSGVKINEMLSTDYDEDTVTLATVYNWVKCFQEACEDVRKDVGDDL